ncbi:hypothetical protein [Desulfovibrio sp. ZJ369]|nr:hypothetical protein [Desulfovibrio sp. ZJ369]
MLFSFVLEHFLIEHIHFQSKTALIAPLPAAAVVVPGKGIALPG